MMIRIQISSTNTTISERSDNVVDWKVVLAGNSNNLTAMSRRLIDSTEMILSEYYSGDNMEEYVFRNYEPIHDEPKIYGISQYGLAKLAV